ncbi:MAG: pentapeptide repeat-containing protein, partial [Verrucomicrobia bacterium]|nr:pentapeptide repeat-containing protein [Verrucomicrobiota bacterium]
LNGCNLAAANCQGVDFSRADLRNADLEALRWKQIKDVTLANLFGAKNLPDGFLTWAMQKGAVTIESSDDWAALIDRETKKGSEK